MLVTGGSSSLGREIVRQAVSRWDVLATFWANPDAVPRVLAANQRVRLDLCDKTAVSRCVSRFQPVSIIHTAGSNRPADFEELIVDGTRHLAEAAAEGGIRLVNLSTDVVFDGEHAPYAETVMPQPLHSYGRAKVKAETIVQQSQANAVTVRTSLIYSLDGDDHTTRWLLNAHAANEPATLFIDEFRSPIWVKSLAAACLELADHHHQGLIHVAGAQRVNRWELGSRLLGAMGVTLDDKIRPGITPAALRSIRPGDCTLDIALAQRILRTPLPGLEKVLARFVPSGPFQRYRIRS